MDCLDIAEKELRNKAPAASTEQPEKEVKNNWNSIDLSRALLKFRLSAAALKVALCVHSHQGFCKTGWNGHYLFHEKHMQEETGFVKDGEEKKIRQGLKDLVSVNAIEEPERIKVKGKWRGKVIKWNFDYSSWGRKNEPEEILPEEILPEEILPEEILPEENPPEEILPEENPPEENPPEENPPEENPPEENPPEENPPVIRIIHNRKDYTDPEDYTESPKDCTGRKDCTGFKDCTRGEDCTEGAAAKPQPAPALPEGAENVPEESAAQNTPGEAASQGCSNTETAHGVPERAPGGRSRRKSGKGSPKQPKAAQSSPKQQFIPPTLEDVIAKLAAAVEDAKAEGKGEAASWDHNDDPRYAANFYRHYSDPKVNWTQKNGKPLKSWELALVNTWLERDNYKVPWKKNQPPGQKFQQGQQELFNERIIGLVESGAATLEGLGITDPEVVSYINNVIAQRRGNSAAL